MKRLRILLFSLLPLLFPVTAAADSVTVGDRTISFTAPAGYVLAAGERYGEAFDFFRKIMPEEMVVHALYMTLESDAAYGREAGAMMDDYLMVTSNRKVDGYQIGAQDFERLKEKIVETQETLLTTAAKDRSNEALGRATDGALKIGNVKPMGIIESTDTQITFMGVMTQSVRQEGRSLTFEQAFSSTNMLVESKLLVINHYRMVKSEADIARFAEDTKKTVAGMAFQQGALPGVGNTFDSGNARGSKRFDTATWAIIGLLAGAGVYFYRRIRARKAAAEEAAMPRSRKRLSGPATDVKIGEKPGKDNEPGGKG